MSIDTPPPPPPPPPPRESSSDSVNVPIDLRAIQDIEPVHRAPDTAASGGGAPTSPRAAGEGASLTASESGDGVAVGSVEAPPSSPDAVNVSATGDVPPGGSSDPVNEPIDLDARSIQDARSTQDTERIHNMVEGESSVGDDAAWDRLYGVDLEPDAAQTDLLNRELGSARISPLKSGEHATEAYRIDYADGTKAVYKPALGEFGHEMTTGQPLRDSIEPGTFWRNEVAAYRTDMALGFNLVPATARFEGNDGVGSLQDWAPNEGLSASTYDRLDQQRMGCFDYIIGNTDRHEGNYLTQDDGRPAAIDNGLAFSTNTSDTLRSEFFPAILDQPLDSAIVDSLQDVDSEEFAGILRESGISDLAVRGAVDRLEEAKTGLVTGRAWHSTIVDGRMNRLK